MDSTNVAQLKTTVIDSIEYITRSDVADFYAHIADKQATQFTILITVLCGIVVILIGATWWWNFSAAKQQITDEINASKQQLIEEVTNAKEVFKRLMNSHGASISEQLKDYEEKFNGFKGSLQKSVNKQIDKKTDEAIATNTQIFDKHIDTINKKFEEDISKFKEKTTTDITMHQAELSRIFALHCDVTKSYLAAANWWLSAAQSYRKADSEHGDGICVAAALDSLQKVDISKIGSNTDFNFDGAISMANDIPEILSSNKKAILSILNELKAKKGAGGDTSVSVEKQ